MKAIRAASLGLVAVLAAGCNGGGGGGGAAASPVAGAWSVISGTSWEEEYAGTITHLELRDDGTGDVFGTRTVPAVRGCAPILHAVLAEGVLAVNAPELADPFYGEDRTRLFSIEPQDGGNLVLRDAQGGWLELAPLDAVPDPVRCEAAVVLEERALPAEAQYSTGLVWTDAGIYYASYSDGTMLIDPATGEQAGMVAVGGGTIHAAQGSDFWVLPGGESAERRTSANAVVDSFTMTDAWGDYVNLRGAAFDGTALFVHGRYQNETRILRVLTEGEPDTVGLSSSGLDVDIHGMTFHGGSLWVVVDLMGSVLVELDPAGLTVLRSIDLPHGAYWHALASNGTELYVLATRYGANDVGTTGLVRIAP